MEKLTKKGRAMIMEETARRMAEYSQNGRYESPSFDYFYRQVIDELIG